MTEGHGNLVGRTADLYVKQIEDLKGLNTDLLEALKKSIRLLREIDNETLDYEDMQPLEAAIAKTENFDSNHWLIK